MSSSTSYPRIAHPSEAQACGKIIIIGEHAAVYGAPAIALPLREKTMQVRFRPQSEAHQATQLFLGGNPAPDALLPLIEKAFALLEVPAFPVVIEGSSSIMAGSGLGSSAALCVVLLRALSRSLGIALSPAHLATLSNELERHFHGTPSGLDTAVVAFEQVICFQKREPQQSNRFQALPVRALSSSTQGGSKTWPFALIDSREHCPTYLMIERVRPHLHGSSGEQRLERFASLTRQVEIGLAEGDCTAVADAMNGAATLLNECEVNTPTMKHLMAAAREEGVLAAKPTGAGGGGHILLLLAPDEPAQQLERLRLRLGRHSVSSVSLLPQEV